MTDKPGFPAGEPFNPAAAPGAAGDHTLRPDPTGRHDPLPGAASASVDRAADAANDLGDRASDLADRARDKITGLADDIHDRLGGSADRVRDRAEAAYDEARGRAGDLHRRNMRRLDDLTVQGLDGLRRSRTQVERFVEDNPLLVGVVGVAAGLLLGALLPRTRQEDRSLGPYADEVRGEGLRYAREMTHRGREFVQSALDPDNLNEVVRKATGAEDETPPAGERTQHNL
ncbi:hypothetical protein ACFQE0_21235 [Methylobacterium komagatae]|uniref:DUF883 family protein n=1 Tax=Methylobacterium komagatae TaxID=374425 RepID=A0ABW2BPX2_9HYPH